MDPSECTTSHPWRVASLGRSCCSPRTHWIRLVALTGTTTSSAAPPNVAGGLAVHEQRQAQIVDRGKVRNRLPRGGLHPAGLAGYQEEEVEPHEEHQAARTRS